jgi:hypothetical protein
MTGTWTENNEDRSRAITMDALLPIREVPTQPSRVESAIPAGFRVPWIDGSDRKTTVSFAMTAGAGCGSKYLTLSVYRDGKPIADEVIDMAEFAQRWVDKVLAEARPTGGSAPGWWATRSTCSPETPPSRGSPPWSPMSRSPAAATG